jgi:cell shape-determining protein MreD
MLLSRYLVPFTYYNLILIILFSLSVSSIESFSIINLISYALLHFTIIYLGLYYYRRSLYSIYFLYGLGFDILLINQIGPHLFIFMTLLFFFNLIKKYFIYFSYLRIYLLILFIQLLIILLEMLLTDFFFDYDFNLDKYVKFIFISIISSYPVFFIFSKIDNLQ